MPRSIPTALQTHLDSATRTLAYLLKITAQDGNSFGVTSHDQDLTYDDGGGPITYSTAIGLQTASVVSDSTLSVGNTEGTFLVVDTGDYFTDEKIRAGVLDFASFVVYRVNWEDLSQGHFIVHAGTTGVVRTLDTLMGMMELRSVSQQLRQSFVELYSIPCRAVFGSDEDSAILPCNFDADSLWVNGTVDAVGAENSRVFTAQAAPAVNGPNGALPFVPGLVQFLTGDNANLYTETEVVAGASISLRFTTAFPIQVGDTFRIRPDCAKRFIQDCRDKYDNVLNFRGEPYIPVLGREV